MVKDLLAIQDSTQKFRLYSSVAQLVNRGYFEKVRSLGLLDEILRILNSDDILEKMNFFPLLETISQNQEGLQWLASSGIWKKLTTSLDSDDFLFSSVVTYFGSLATFGDIGINFIVDNGVLETLREVLAENSDAAKEPVIGALGRIGSVPKGLREMVRAKIIKPLFDQIGRENLRNTTLHSVGNLLSKFPIPITLKDTEYLDAIQTRFREGDLLDVTWPFLQTPFVDTRYGAYHVLNGLATHPAGVSRLMRYPGLPEWIFNRATEETKEGLMPWNQL
eukprot:TRINITY_DN1260_c3_g1_i1.p1 TRINITY_DN1260_c3_g1~~TRINITY_DN1260_c3_g1_i1.p1  ORF type:complete len:313 (-),score=63.65 TRINITY_DN1260_c3_g1_i1:218-1051(-)